jgi:large subunit ribosomal protein L9
MKVLLIQDVDNLGYAGEVKKVANGFGRNYLLPQQMAVLATPGALKQAETIRKTAEKQRAQQTADAQAIANQLVNLELMFERRAGETGKLYGSVTSTDIAEAILGKTQIEVDRRKVALPEPIRTLGEQEVTIKLMIDVSTTIKVSVVPEGGVLQKERIERAAVVEEAEDIEAGAEELMAEAEVEAATELVEEAEAETEEEEESETGEDQ